MSSYELSGHSGNGVFRPSEGLIDLFIKIVDIMDNGFIFCCFVNGRPAGKPDLLNGVNLDHSIWIK